MAVTASCKKKHGADRVETVREAGYELNQPAFFRAAESDDRQALDAMIDAGMAIDLRDAKGRSALHAAAGAGAVKSVDYLLDQGLEIDLRDGLGRTPLMEAVLRSNPEMVRHLLRQGADPREKDSQSYKPLMLAVSAGRAELVGELAPYVREDLDDSLLVAAILGQAAVIDELTNHGASVYARLEDGRTPLMLAAERGHAEAAEMLLSIGANRFAMDSVGRMAADLAREGGHGALAERLAGEPRAGDFELVEPAELGVEMVMRMREENRDAVPTAPPVPGDGQALALRDEGDGTTGGAVSPGPDVAGATPRAVGREPGGSPGGAPGVQTLEGALVGPAKPVEPAGVALPPSLAEEADAPIVMRSYRERELPLRVESTTGEAVRLRMPGGDLLEVPEGAVIPGSSLKVIRIERRLRSGKNDGGAPTEVSVVEVGDENTGVERELIAGLPALAHDPVALVEDAASGDYYVAEIGQRFRSADGRGFVVGDVRPNQVVIEDEQSGRTITLRLRGPDG